MIDRLEDLLKQGWEERGKFADLQILAKDTQRILYDPKEQQVYLKYEVDLGVKQ